MDFSLLGPVRGWRDGRELDLGPPQQRSLLVVLLLAEGRAVGPAQLADALWGDDLPASAIRTVRSYVSRLRAVVGDDVLASVEGGYRLTAELAVHADCAPDPRLRVSVDLDGEVIGEIRRLLGVDAGPEPTASPAPRPRAASRTVPRLSPRAGTAPRQLPADIADFTGRTAQQERLKRSLRSCALSAISGVPGVGKTALAVHVAHALVGDFPDGQLYVDLRGPAEPGQVLAAFLRALGVATVPEDHREREALYRATVADRRLLVLLDNAVDAGQVRGLIPEAGGCAVLVTARDRLAGLPTATHVELGPLSPGEALALFARIVGESRVAAEREAAAATVAACGFVPLAIRSAASRLAARPAWTVAHLHHRLTEEARHRPPGVLGRFSRLSRPDKSPTRG